jgi:hypothetical protein
MTRYFIKDNKIFTFNIVASGILTGCMSLLGTLDPLSKEDDSLRHFLARIILVGTLVLVLLEIYLARIYNYSSS